MILPRKSTNKTAYFGVHWACAHRHIDTMYIEAVHVNNKIVINEQNLTKTQSNVSQQPKS